jgi:hypothetical protein
MFSLGYAWEGFQETSRDSNDFIPLAISFTYSNYG